MSSILFYRFPPNPSIMPAIKVRMIEGFKLEGLDDKGHSITMDLPKDLGGEGAGFTPMELLLITLAGCTTLDIINILRKQRQNLSSLEVYAEGDRAEEPPRYYTQIRLKYILKGNALSEDAVKRAICLSEEKYCSVMANLRGMSKITTSYEIK
ncbi:MAG: OsmC family protein [Nitrososphaerales archaeon]